MSRVGFQAEGINMLTDMLRATPRVRKAQAMEARGNPYFPDLHTRVDHLGVERHEAYRLWEHQERIRLGTVWLCGQWGAAEQSECPSKKQYEPTPSSLHVLLSMSLRRSVM